TALFIIQAIGNQATPAEISRWILREPHSVSGLLDRMERRGLIKRTKDLAWKNMIRVTVTEQGKEAYKISTARESIHKILSVLSDEECWQLGSYLRTIRDKALDQLNTDYEMPFP
ncbi:MAG: MarR family transcriptional regulator, partial [Dehalococcoidales bacterium]